MPKRKKYLEGGGDPNKPILPPSRGNQVISGIEGRVGSILNPYYSPINTGLNIAENVQVGDKVIDPRVISILDKANSTVNKIVQGVVDTVVPGGSTPIRDLIKARRERKKAEEEEEEVEEETTTQGAFRGGRISKQMGELVTQEDQPILDDQMTSLMSDEQETHTMSDGTVMPGATHEEYEQMLPDEEMEEDYVDFVVSSTLDEEDKNYLESALAEDAKLSEIFDQVVESASEFSGSGPVEGLGSGVSDSIPARLSDGEFVFTAKATDEIGADNLQRMMEDAEAGADGRQGVAYGGMVEDEGDPKAVPIQTTGSQAAQGNVPNVVRQSREIEEEMLKASPRRYYVPLSG